MDKIVFKANRREIVGKHVKTLRRAGKLPAILYGRHLAAPINIELDLRDATRPLNTLAPSALVTIDLGDEQHTALVREKQRNFMTGGLLHVDFQVVSMTETLRTKVNIELTGESPAVKNFNGMLIFPLEAVEVEALPGDLPEKITISVAGLKRIGDAIHVRDLKLSDKVTILANPDEVVALVALQAGAEMVEGAFDGPAEPEVIEKGKKEDEDF